MRQAIEESLILDVLQNYTSYKLAHDGKDYDETTVERAAAVKSIMDWGRLHPCSPCTCRVKGIMGRVRLHPYNISQKVAAVVGHFCAHLADPLVKRSLKDILLDNARLWETLRERAVG